MAYLTMHRTLLLLALLAAACSRPEQTRSAVGASQAAAAPQPTLVPHPRVSSVALDELRLALDLGELAQARARIGASESAGPEEAWLLRARLAALEGKGIEALRLVEAARAAHPRSPAVFATAAEIYAASEGFDSAAREIVRGEKECGNSPEFLRARGIVSILKPGGAAKGLAELEAARAADPKLPFAARPLGQAHLLVAKQAAQKDQRALALSHAQLSVSFDPLDVDARRFLAECLAGNGEFEGALKLMQSLVEAGEPLQAEWALLEKRAGIAALLQRERERALAHFRAARRLGLDDEELSSGARLLAEHSAAQLSRGIESYERKDYAAAEQAFRAALADDPDSLAARNHLAVALHALGQHAQAAELWEAVLRVARDEGLELPEPVELNLARACAAAGQTDKSRTTLEQFLQRNPDGPHALLARTLLEKLKESH
jgi:tetratricopeptide (TPR) repeat protein